jgi:carboxypeptidase family protein/IPT/TIG domain-containing protein
MRKFCFSLMVLAAASLFASELCAQNNPVYFPYVVNDGSTVTELLFTNTTSRDASLTLTGFQEDGTAVAGPALVVPGNSQAVVSAFGGLSGWVLAESNAPGVVGNVRVRSADGSAQDIGEPAQPNTIIILPFVAQTGGSSTEISVVNPSPYFTRVNLEVRNAGGTALATIDRQVPPFGSFRGSLSDVFGSERTYDDASHVIARSVPANIFSQEVKIVGFEVVRSFSRTESSLDKILGRTDWAALSAVPATGTGSTLTFPQVVRGMDRFTLIGLVNTGASDQSVTLTYSIAGTTTVLNSGPVLIRANGSLRQTVVDLFGPAGTAGDHGVLRVTGANAVRGFLATGSSSGSAIAATPAQVSGQTEFLFPAVEKSTTSGTGIALLNDGQARVEVDLFLISPQGATLGRAHRSLDPQQRVVEPVESLFLEALTQPGGYIFVGSTGPIFGYEELGVLSKTFSLLTPQQATGLFPQTQFLLGIRGRITDYSATGTGAAVPGVTVVLSRVGDTDITATTDPNGEYLFGNLFPGDYIVKPQQAGRMFSPFNPAVRLDTGSRRVDFVRSLLPSLSSITVVTNDDSGSQTAGNNPDPYAIFGTAEVSLKIQGTNFAPGQKLFFKQPGNLLNPNGREILFSFVDSTTLFVRLNLSNPSDLSQLATTGRYELEIAGQTPFGEVRSNALPFYVVPPLPVVTRITPTETYARYEINSDGLTVRVEGFGFRQGARVLFNGATGIEGIEIDTTYVRPTLLEAFIPAQALRFGGFYSVRVRNVSLLPEVSGEAVTFQVNNLGPTITSLDPPGPLAIIGPGPVPVTFDLKINGSNFFPQTVVAVTQKIPDIFPAIVPVGGISQCVPVNGRTVLRVRVYDSVGQPAGGVAVTFTAPTIATTGPSGAFPGGAPSVTVMSDPFGFAPPLTDDSSTLFTANPFSGPYVIQINGTVDGFQILAVINMTNLGQGEGCEAINSTVEFVSSNQIIVSPVSITSRGTYSVVVANPSPGGGYSNEVEFIVTSGAAGGIPIIRADNPLSPASRLSGSGAFNLTIFGENFQSDAWVNFGTVRLNRISGSDTSITVTVPALLISSPGVVPVSVTNPGGSGSTGGTSRREFFAVQ